MEKYNKWTVVEQAGRDRWGSALVKCICDCGFVGNVRLSDLKSNTTIQCRACGYKYKRSVPRIKSPIAGLGNNYRHGKSRAGTYQSWCSMIYRCGDMTGKNYKWYAARSITVCERWKDFLSFLEDMGEKPDRTVIDRIDNDKGYFKENCRWATFKESSNNRRCVKAKSIS